MPGPRAKLLGACLAIEGLAVVLSPRYLDATATTSEDVGDRFPVSVGREAHRLGELLHGDRLLPAHVDHAAQQRLCHVEGVGGQSHSALAPLFCPPSEI